MPLATKKKRNSNTPNLAGAMRGDLAGYRHLGPLVDIFSRHAVSLLKRLAYIGAYRTRRGVLSLVRFMATAHDRFDHTDLPLFETTLKNWRDELYRGKSEKRVYTRNFITAVFAYIKNLQKTDAMPRFRVPSATWSRPPKLRKLKKPKYRPVRRPKPHALTAVCVDDRGAWRSYDLRELAYLGTVATELVRRLPEVYAGLSYGGQARRHKTILAMFRFIKEHHLTFSPHDPKQLLTVLLKFREHFYRNRNGAGIATRNDDWRALCVLLTQLMRLRILAKVQLPEAFRKADKFRDMNRTSRNHLGTILKGIRRFDAAGKTVESAFDISLFEKDDVFLDHFYRDQRWAFDLLRDAAIRECREAIKDFRRGQKLIAKCDIEYLRAVYQDTGELCDPHFANRGQPLSFFSPNHPQGLSNLLGWIWHEHDGILKHRAFRGFDHAYRHGSIERMKRMLGLTTDTANAFFIVILGETATNVESLERATVENKHGHSLLMVPTDSGEHVRIHTMKPRAGKSILKLLSAGDDTEINAYACLQAVLEMTAKFREHSKLKDLWTHSYFSKCTSAQPISGYGFVGAFSRFLKRHPELKLLKKRGATRAMIRGTAGILEWFETGGNMLKAAEKLGNSPNIAMRRYIPKEIQDALYRREIRRFQQLLILVSTKDTDRVLPAMGYTSRKQLDRDLKAILNNPNYSGTELVNILFAAKPSTKKPAKELPKVTFVISPENVALLKLYVEYIRRQKLAHPRLDLDCAAGQTPLSFWIELWALLEINFRDSFDRGVRQRFEQGMKLAEATVDSITFPSLI